ncbi:ras-related protein [Reticulomyxa filosa]|uniref:Ras-related protein n=1 Tax=Reticulomyxa filosa TaxID=46433 RepID=X6ML86_RETFI|nr:ras-related protein [Reticulomyxa filosa]|eukprot:ETO14222.1 ras-related protein [Reticulomyxa filosa]
MKSEWFRKGEGFIIVYSITSEDSLLKDASKFREEILSEKKKAKVPMYFIFSFVDLFDFKICVQKKKKKLFLLKKGCNKCDLSTQRKVATEKGKQIAKEWYVLNKHFVLLLIIKKKKRGCPFFESSAKDKINVEAIFEECVREIRKARVTTPSEPTTTETSSSCCAIL